MLAASFILLLFNLNILKCASTEDQNVNVTENNVSETPSQSDIISRYLTSGELLHLVLQYDAKSTGRIALVNKDLQTLATDSRVFRFFEGAGWDMPELANISDFGVKDTINRPELEVEKAKIMELTHIKEETVFNETLENLLLVDNSFKELASPVLKYLIRRLYERNENWKRDKLRKYLVFAVKNRLYDVFFDLSKDPFVWNSETLDVIISGDRHYSFYFDFYNDFVYDNPAAFAYIWKKMTAIEPKDYVHSYKTFCPGGAKLSRDELYAWVAVCIFRRVSEEKYAPYLIKIPKAFLIIIQEFLYNYSPITFDIDEKDYFHRFINDLIDKYFGDYVRLGEEVIFTKVLNNIRFGYVNNEFVYQDCIKLHRLEFGFCEYLARLSVAASKANNKSLVKMLVNHGPLLRSKVDIKNPQSFKVFFDIIEDAPIKDKSGRGNFAEFRMIEAIILNRNNFKITKAIPASFGVKFEVQTSVDYVKLGFAPKYDIVIWPGCFSIATFIQFMFEDAAKAGVYEFIRVVTEYCSVQVDEEIFHYYKSLTVSYEVIELLLEHQELIGMLANFSVKLQCNDKRIKPEEIANFRRVINPHRRR